MKTVFIKYNRERRPLFQTVTKIMELEELSMFAVKEALLPEAIPHIHEMYSNYKLLKAKYENIRLCKPTFYNDNSLRFEMASGVSLEKILQDATNKNDKDTYIKVIKKYIDYVDMFVSKRQIKFTPSAKFCEIFGEWQNNCLEDIVDIANVDMIFGNLFLHGDEISQIDYEWVFEFPIPKSFLLWRSIYVSFICYKIGHGLILFEELLELIGCNEIIHQQYLQLDANLQVYVYGSEKKYLLNTQALKSCTSVLSVTTEISHMNKKLLDKDLQLKRKDVLINEIEAVVRKTEQAVWNAEAQILEKNALILEKDKIILNLLSKNNF